MGYVTEYKKDKGSRVAQVLGAVGKGVEAIGNAMTASEEMKMKRQQTQAQLETLAQKREQMAAQTAQQAEEMKWKKLGATANAVTLIGNMDPELFKVSGKTLTDQLSKLTSSPIDGDVLTAFQRSKSNPIFTQFLAEARSTGNVDAYQKPEVMNQLRATSMALFGQSKGIEFLDGIMNGASKLRAERQPIMQGTPVTPQVLEQTKGSNLQAQPNAQGGFGLGVKPEKPVGLTKGQEQYDRDFAKTLQAYDAAGGSSTVRADLKNLKYALDLVKSGKHNLSGSFVGKIPNFLEPYMPGGNRRLSVLESVQAVVQKTLRVTLGAQFTENEGKRLIERAYNPNLPEKENARRVGILYNQIEEMAKAKEAAGKYFKSHNGSMAGYNGLVVPEPSGTDPETGKPIYTAEDVERFGSGTSYDNVSDDQLNDLDKKYAK